MSTATAHPESSHFTIQSISDVGGAEIHGLDLREPLSEGARARVWRAFLEHHILVFRDQNLTPEEQTRFSLNWGELENHVIRLPDGHTPPLVHVVSNLDVDGNPTERPHTTGNYFWHTDKSYHAVPSLLTMLHAIELPPEGGDTQFANTARAYDALPSELKSEIEGLTAVHSWEASRRNAGQRPATEAEKADRPPVTHPLVRTHPDTGRRTLYVGNHVSHIEGVSTARAEGLLAELNERATRPEFVYTHQWRLGDLVMWDNRTLLHRAVANYQMAGHRRVLHRTVIKGTVPS